MVNNLKTNEEIINYDFHTQLCLDLSKCIYKYLKRGKELKISRNKMFALLLQDLNEHSKHCCEQLFYGEENKYNESPI